VQLPATNCARTRESISAQLDGELPELELARLETHLLICPECSAWAEDVEEATRRLRGACLEVPVASYGVARHGRRLVGASLPAVAATVAAASVAAILALHPARLTAPGLSGRSAFDDPGRVRLLPQDRLVRLDGGFVFSVRTLSQRGGLRPT
jgi:anti-sigma factor RsiW